MNGQWYLGAAVGVGVGYLNATVLSFPAWANMALIAILAIVGGFARREGRSAFGGDSVE